MGDANTNKIKIVCGGANANITQKVGCNVKISQSFFFFWLGFDYLRIRLI